MLRKIKNVKQTVKSILENCPEARDSDDLLLSFIWKAESNAYTAKRLLDHIASGELSNPESIRRARQLLQAKYPELQGKKRAAKKAAAEEMRTEINNI